MKQKCLFIHGLGAKHRKDVEEKLSELYDVIYPEINYKTDSSPYHTCLKIAEENKVDVVIGHSVGGVIAYYISKAINVPALLLEPAFNGDYEVIVWGDGIYNPKMFVLFGMSDEEVDKWGGINKLKYEKNCTVEFINKGHDLTADDIYEYAKKFNSYLYGTHKPLLLAPNGKPSNLTSEQYKLVRTPAFKAWFGDWENEKKNKNMALDSNGEPLVFWHSGGEFYKMRKEEDQDGLMFSLGKESRAYSKDGKAITRPYFIKSDKIYLVKYEHRNSPLIYQNKKHKFPLYMVNAYGGFVIVHEPTQIKLADGTNTAFDSEDDDIRFNKGGEILLAPNGKTSNLTPEQYKLTRTPEFISWFGDFINSPEKASKVVDENGDPLVCYHGSKSEFNVFKNSKYDGWYFFTPDKEDAIDWAGNVGGNVIRQYFLNSRNPKEKIDIQSEIKVGRINKSKYDGATKGNPISIWAVANNAQIKLADGTNKTFDSGSDDIRFNDGGDISNGKQSYEQFIKSESFKKWFGDYTQDDRTDVSKIVDNKGLPLIVYHGTHIKRPFIGEVKGDIGIHFGTRKASVDRLESIGVDDGDISGYFLSIINPIRIRDVGAWADFKDVADELLIKGIITKKEYIIAEDFAKAQSVFSGCEHKGLVKILKSKGYDGFVYENTSEDIGSDSYIVFDTSQIMECEFIDTVFYVSEKNTGVNKAFDKGGNLRSKEIIKEKYFSITGDKGDVVGVVNATEQSDADHQKYIDELLDLGCILNKITKKEYDEWNLGDELTGDDLKSGNYIDTRYATFDNFMNNTTANFTKINDVPSRKPDFVSDSGSKYWHLPEEKIVIRKADHWGKLNSCSWFLNNKESNIMETGMCKLSDFKTNSENFKDGGEMDSLEKVKVDKAMRSLIEMMKYKTLTDAGKTKEDVFIDRVVALIYEGKEFKSKVSIESLAEKEFGFTDKQKVRELTEYAIIIVGRDIARAFPDIEEAYPKLVALYSNQPYSTHKTSVSVSLGQFSTPVPMSYLMGKYVGLSYEKNKKEDYTFYHGTSTENITSIKNGGFDLSRADFYSTTDIGEALSYGCDNAKQSSLLIIKPKTDAKLLDISNPFIGIELGFVTVVHKYDIIDYNIDQSKLEDSARNGGYDGYIYPQSLSGGGVSVDYATKDRWLQIINPIAFEYDYIVNKFTCFDYKKYMEKPADYGDYFIKLRKKELEKEGLKKTVDFKERIEGGDKYDEIYLALEKSYFNHELIEKKYGYENMLQAAYSLLRKPLYDNIKKFYPKSDSSDKIFFEPTAGNGMLTVAGSPDIIIANELDANRYNNLIKENYKQVLNQDANKPFNFDFLFDGMIANPPFGATPETLIADGGFKISGLEQQIIFRSLRYIKPEGKVAFIIGGHTEFDSAGRIKSAKDKSFLSYLYSHYVMDDVINMNGSLYGRQGTKYPIRIILINKRKEKSGGFFPLENKTLDNLTPFSTKQINNFDELLLRFKNSF